MSIGTHSASRAMPALPGAHHNFVVSGEPAIFQASACSRPPPPRRRIFMAGALTWAGLPASAMEPQSSANSNRGPRPRRQRVWIDLDHAVAQSNPIGCELFGEGRRRAAVLEPVLVAVPRAGDEPVDDTAFAKRPVLMRAQVGQRADLVAVAEYRDAFAIGRH